MVYQCFHLLRFVNTILNLYHVFWISHIWQYIYIHIYIHAYIHRLKQRHPKCARRSIHSSDWFYPKSRFHLYVITCMRTYIRTYTHTYIYVHTHTYKQHMTKYVHIKFSQLLTHTYIHIHKFMLNRHWRCSRRTLSKLVSSRTRFQMAERPLFIGTYYPVFKIIPYLI